MQRRKEGIWEVQQVRRTISVLMLNHTSKGAFIDNTRTDELTFMWQECQLTRSLSFISASLPRLSQFECLFSRRTSQASLFVFFLSGRRYSCGNEHYSFFFPIESNRVESKLQTSRATRLETSDALAGSAQEVVFQKTISRYFRMIYVSLLYSKFYQPRTS